MMHMLTVSQIPWLQAVAAGDAITEVIIILLPIIGFYNTLMPKKRRMAVIMAFYTRLPYVAKPRVNIT
jgi:hypothetical protein